MTTDHSARLQIASELHTRPFPEVGPPCMVVFLALMEEGAAATRDRGADLDTLRALLAHYGAAEPSDGATHYFGEVGRGRLKWECHTEFVTYTFFLPLREDAGFDATYFDAFPSDWMSREVSISISSLAIVSAPMDPVC